MGNLRLFGSFQFNVRGKPIILGQPRLEELIALLALRPGEPVPRVEIAYRIWPDSSEKQARANVRNLLYKLRQIWPEMGAAIAVERTHVTWCADGDIAVDVHRFETLRRKVGKTRDVDECIALLTEAADLYRGDLLPNCFADWALTARERLRDEYAELLEQLIDSLRAQRRYDGALARAKGLQRFDPLRESAYRQLMQTYAALGDRAAALRVYHTCASTLQQELGVEPAPATESLRTQLLHLEAQATGADAPQSVQRERLVGRHHEWQQLQDAWRRAQQGETRCVLLLGEAGIGKTRLAEEVMDWVQRHGFSLASSRSYAVEGALTYAPIAEWLRSPAIRPALEELDDLWRVELSRLLPGLLADRPDLPPPGPMTESWQQQRFFQGIVHAMQAAPGPILLHLDDMQWSDAETLTLLQYLLHGARRYPLLLVGGIRTEDAGGNDALAAFIEATRHAGQLAELRLGPLSAGEATELAAQTAGKAVASAIAKSLYASSEGHPLYLIEAVRSGLTEPQPVREHGEPSAADLHSVSAMPPRIYNLLAARLGQLSPLALQVAGTAAVIGRAFDYEILHAVVSLDEMALIDALDELWRRRIIREQAGDSYDFSHDRIREVAYQEISRARRRFYHRQVAEALEAVHGDVLDDIAGELAAHYAQVGDSKKAYQYYRQAADVALAQHALGRAAEMLDAALVHISDDPVGLIELLQYQDRIFNRSLAFERWEDNLSEEKELLDAIDAPAQRLILAYELSRSRYLTNMGQVDMAVAAAQQALLLAKKMRESRSLTSCYHVLGKALQQQARIAEAGRAFGQMSIYAKQAGDRTAECKALGAQAAVGMFSGMPADELLDLLIRALAIAEEQDDKSEMSILYVKFGYARTETGMGQFAQIEQDLRKSLYLGEKIGDRGRIYLAWNHLGQFYTKSGDYRQAQNALFNCRKLECEQQAYWRNWETLHYLGTLRMQTGNIEAARTTLVSASEQLGQTGSHHYEVKARCDLGLVHHLIAEHVLAHTEFDTALSLLEGYGDLRLEALVNTRLGYVLEAMKQLAEARNCYERGCQLHHQMGQHYYAMNALAGLARVAVLQGDNDVALDHVVIIWETIGGKEMDATIETARTLRTCYTIFDDRSDLRADAVFTMAWEQLQRRASTIDDPDHVEQFWQIEDHRFFLDLMS